MTLATRQWSERRFWLQSSGLQLLDRAVLPERLRRRSADYCWVIYPEELIRIECQHLCAHERSHECRRSGTD
jgi:hypothetical protein